MEKNELHPRSDPLASHLFPEYALYRVDLVEHLLEPQLVRLVRHYKQVLIMYALPGTRQLTPRHL